MSELIQHKDGDTVSVSDASYEVAKGVDIVLLTLTAGALANKNVTLPPVAGNKGRYLTLILVAQASSVDYLVDDAGDDAYFSQLVLDTADDRALLYCDGRHWWNLINEADLIA